jgi:hypothetical protein
MADTPPEGIPVQPEPPKPAAVAHEDKQDRIIEKLETIIEKLNSTGTQALPVQPSLEPDEVPTTIPWTHRKIV